MAVKANAGRKRSELKIGIDAHRLMCEPFSSGAVYLAAFFRGFRELADSPVLVAYVPQQPVAPLPALEGIPRLVLRNPPRPLHPVASYRHQLLWNQIWLPRMARRDDLDLFFCPFHLTPLLLGSVPVATTIHDLCFLSHRQSFSHLGRLIHTLEIHTALVRARSLIAVSDFTLGQLARFYPKASARTTRIYTGVEAPSLTRCNTGSYFLWIGRRDSRKCPDVVLAGFRVYLDSMQDATESLVLLVPSRDREFFESRAHDYAIEHRTVVRSGVSEAEKWDLLAKAIALVFPSSCEGFGVPTLEALHAGCPPLISTEGPGSEFVPPDVPRLERLDPPELARLLKWARSLPAPAAVALSEKLQDAARRLTPRHMAEQMLNLFFALAGAEK